MESQRGIRTFLGPLATASAYQTVDNVSAMILHSLHVLSRSQNNLLTSQALHSSFCLRHGLTTYPWLTWDLPRRPSWA